MLNRTNRILAVVLVLVIALALSSRVDYSRPNFEILPDMKYTPAWTTYKANPVFTDGRTLQAPVSGTIARGQMPLHFEATKEDAARAGEELANPFGSDGSAESTASLQASVARGAETFRVYCVCCHGATGLGDGPVTKRGFPPPPSLLTGKSRQMKDGQLFHILTYGQASMPDFTGQLSPARRWDGVNYIRNLQANSAAPSTEAPAAGAEPIQDTGTTDPNASETPKPAIDPPKPEGQPNQEQP